ncbi:MAG: TerC family protein [Planctomycetaceae bacterium]|nr:TerC family protein [Planctomycetaceae bacterium]
MLDLFTPENAIAFLTLTSLEIVLGIDNVIFIAILAAKLPVEQRDRARQLGLGLAVISRVALLLAIGWVVKLEEPFVTLIGHAISGKDLVLLIGGVFLIGKATYEIHHKVQGSHDDTQVAPGKVATLGAMLVQVVGIDIVFSLDSVITAVGLCKSIPIMVAAILASVVVMLVFSGPVVRFVDAHPAIKLLALAFLLLIGVLLVAEGFHQKIDKGYIYFGMAFALGIELLQMRAERNQLRHAAGKSHLP